MIRQIWTPFPYFKSDHIRWLEWNCDYLQAKISDHWKRVILLHHKFHWLEYYNSSCRILVVILHEKYRLFSFLVDCCNTMWEATEKYTCIPIYVHIYWLSTWSYKSTKLPTKFATEIVSSICWLSSWSYKSKKCTGKFTTDSLQ